MKSDWGWKIPNKTSVEMTSNMGHLMELNPVDQGLFGPLISILKYDVNDQRPESLSRLRRLY